MKSYKTMVNGKIFETQKELKDYTRNILLSYKAGDTVTDEHKEFLLALLENHPHSNQKIGAGVDRIFVSLEPIYRKSNCFNLVRVDGSCDNFSFLECICSSSLSTNVRIAFRQAIKSHIDAFRRDFFEKNPTAFCPDTGDQLTPKDSHVDHKAPQTFHQLLRQFMDLYSLSYQDIELVPPFDKQTGEQLASESLKSQWIKFHNENAVLEVVSKRANLSNRNKQSYLKEKQRLIDPDLQFLVL